MHRLIITLTLATFGLCYTQAVLSCDSIVDNLPVISDTDNIEANITQQLERAIKLATPIEELATACETEYENNGNKLTINTGISCLCFQLASNRFEYARIRLNIALVALDWDDLSMILHNWALRRDDLKFLDATHDRIKTLEESLINMNLN